MLGDNIKSLRISKDMTQEELAKKSGVNRVSIGNYERGDREPNINTLIKIANALNVSVTELTNPIWDEFDKKVDVEGLKKDMNTIKSLSELLVKHNYCIELIDNDKVDIMDYKTDKTLTVISEVDFINKGNEFLSELKEINQLLVNQWINRIIKNTK